nr:MAG TPA: hypothetical protein [Caudoviricetes sp.]
MRLHFMRNLLPGRGGQISRTKKCVQRPGASC